MEVTATGRRANQVRALSVPDMTRYLAPLLTLIGVPVGLMATGGNITAEMTLSLAVWLAVLACFVRRWPLTVAIISLISVAAMRFSYLIGSGWVWPVTA